MSHLGRFVTCDLMPGLTGTVVHENKSLGRWPRAAPSYDVLWENQSCTRAVAQTLIESPAWQFLPQPRLAQSECNARWYDHQVERTRQLAARKVAHGRPAPAAAALPPMIQHSAATYAAGLAAAMATHSPPAAQTTARVAAREARQLLAERMPGATFAVSCERRTLSVTWMDGPLPGNVYRTLSPLVDRRAVERIRLQRGLSEALVQAAADYCLWRGCGNDQVAATRLRERVTPRAYLSLALESLRAESGEASGLCYQRLLRCILDRWDDELRQFVPSRSTAVLVQEVRTMFPDGDVAATGDFNTFRDAALAQLAGGELIGQMRGADREH